VCSIFESPVRFLSSTDQSGGPIVCHRYEGDSLGVSYWLFRIAQWVLEKVP
jgi:hypothetical protein